MANKIILKRHKDFLKSSAILALSAQFLGKLYVNSTNFLKYFQSWFIFPSTFSVPFSKIVSKFLQIKKNSLMLRSSQFFKSYLNFPPLILRKQVVLKNLMNIIQGTHFSSHIFYFLYSSWSTRLNCRKGLAHTWKP